MGRRRKPLVEGSQDFLDELRRNTLNELNRPIAEIRRRYRGRDESMIDRLVEAANRVADRHHREHGDRTQEPNRGE